MSPGELLVLKRVLAVVLLAFVAVSVATLVVQESRRGGAEASAAGGAAPGGGPAPADQVVAFYFHRTARCASCRRIEAISRQAIEVHFADALRGGRLAWRLANLDDAANAHFAKDFDLGAQSVVLVEVKDGKPVRWKNLEKVWDLLDDEAGMGEYVRKEVAAFLGS